MRFNNSKISYFALFMFSMLLSACGGGGSGTPPATTPAAKTLTSIALTPTTATVAKGLNTHFTATGTYSDATTADITSQVLWVSGNTAVATINSATAIATGVAVGSATITASLNGISSPAANLTVTAAVITAIAINPASASVGAGLTSNFTATGTYSDSTTANVTNQVIWTSGNTGVATINSISGVATGVAVGSTTITASANGVTSPAASLSVTTAVLTGISISPLVPSTPKGKPVTFSATGTYSDGTTGNVSGAVIWTSSNTAVATLNASGIASSLAVGTSNISASVGGVTSNSATLTVTAPILTAIAISPSVTTVSAGLTTSFIATGTYTDATTANFTNQVIWLSANTAIAAISTAGIATGMSVGSTTITASATGIASPAVSLTVTAAVLTGISISPLAPSTPKGLPVTFTATGTYSNASTGNISGSVTWTSSNVAVATVNTSGVATSLSQGVTTITATLSGVTASTTLTVTAPVLATIGLLSTPSVPSGSTPTGPQSTAAPNIPTSVPVGYSTQFTAVGKLTDGTAATLGPLVWASSNPVVATVSNAGLATSASIGSTNITASSGGVTSTFALLVAPGLTVLTLTPALVTVSPQQLTATGSYSDGTTRDITSTMQGWTSSQPCFATVGPTGLVTKNTGLTLCITVLPTTISVGFPVGTAPTAIEHSALVQ